MHVKNFITIFLVFVSLFLLSACGGGGGAGEAANSPTEKEFTGDVSINSITEDNMISPTEAGESITISGSATGGYIKSGDVVTFSVNDTNYTTVVENDGYWSVDVAGIDLASDIEVAVTVESQNPSGEIVLTSITSKHAVDAAASFGTIVMSPITEDNILNASEINQDIIISGLALGKDITSGDIVSFVVNEHLYTTKVKQDGTWSVKVSGADLAVDTKFIVNIEIKKLTDKNELLVGDLDNEGTQELVAVSTTSMHSVDTQAEAGVVTVNPVTADNVINKTESSQSIKVDGTAIGGDISQGDSVSLSINNKNYSTTVGADGSWSITLAGADLGADTEFIVSVESQDSAGNSITSSVTSQHSVDLEAQGGSVSVANITEDDIINGSEASEAIIVHGSANGGDIKEGDRVTFRVNTVDYTTTLKADGTWSINVSGADLAADKEFIVKLYSYDAAGNEVISSVTSTHEVDTTAQSGNVTINSITQDNVINKTEASQTITLSGSASGGDIKVGDDVSFVINGALYSTTLKADGSWSIDVAGADLAADSSFRVEVESFDNAGNRVISSVVAVHTVNTVDDDKSTVRAKLTSLTIDVRASGVYNGIVVNGSVLSGLEYGCDNARYLTGQYGEVTCENLPIVFYVGNIEIGSVSEINQDKVIYFQDIFQLPRGGTRHPLVTKASVLVQTLDEDADLSNGINLLQSTVDLLSNNFAIETKLVDLSLDEIQSALQNVQQSKLQQTPSVTLDLVNTDDAQDNLTRVMAHPFNVNEISASTALTNVNILQGIEENIADALESNSILKMDNSDAFTLWTQGTSSDEMHPVVTLYLKHSTTLGKTYEIRFNAIIKTGSPMISNIAFSDTNSLYHHIVEGENIIKIKPSAAGVTMIKLYFDGQTEWEFSSTDMSIVEL